MTIAECKREFGDNAEIMVKTICGYCNDGYCPENSCYLTDWVRKHKKKAIDRLAKLDGDLVAFNTGVKRWA